MTAEFLRLGAYVLVVASAFMIGYSRGRASAVAEQAMKDTAKHLALYEKDGE
jgi:hypothetical protein